MTYKNFEDFLGSKHADGYMGCDDDMSDSFDNWLCDLDAEEWIKYADEYGELKLIQGHNDK